MPRDSLRDCGLWHLQHYLRNETLRTLSHRACKDVGDFSTHLAVLGVMQIKDRNALLTAITRARRQGRFLY